MVLTVRSGAAAGRASARAMAEYQASTMDVPELAARLTAYLGEAYGPELAGGTAAIPARNMHPLIADLLGIDTSRSLTIDEMTNLLAALRADGQPIPGKEVQRSTKDKVRIAFTDFTFSAPKSFSIALALAPSDAERQTLETCWLRANARLCDVIASNIGKAQVGRSGRHGSVLGHMAVVHYNHYTARPTVMLADGEDTRIAAVPQGSTLRPGDMQRHTHNIFLHVTITDDGQVRAPNRDEAAERIHEWGAIGHAFLATELRQHGVRVEIDPESGLSHLPDVPRSAVDLFSARTETGEEAARRYAAEQGVDWDTASPKVRADLIAGRVGVSRQGKTEGPADYASWLKTAADAGYQHQSVIDPAYTWQRPEPAEQARVAYETSLPMLEEEWTRRAKLEGSVPRIMAARGLIASGIRQASDVEAVLSAYRTEGVLQDGRKTSIIEAPEHGKRFGAVTTALHVSEEREAIALLAAAARDGTDAITKEQFAAAAKRVAAAKGYDFDSEHGRKQYAFGEAVATGGRAAVGIGKAGVGKTAVAAAVIEAHHAAGYRSIGTTLAWRQTHGLVDAGVSAKKKGPKLEPDTDRLVDVGINQRDAFALEPFLTGVEKGDIRLDRKTLVVVDEVAVIGTRHILRLARLQAEHGFKVSAFGDDEQCQSIAAGHSVKLFRHALGPDQVPELLDSIRQKRIEDRETADLFRQGKAAEALERKDQAGLLTLVPGSYHDTIRAGVDWWESRIAGNENREKYSVGVSVPTNADVRAFGLEVRSRQRAAGKLTGDDWTIKAADQNGVQSDMAIAVGDTVRLFNRVNARFGDRSRGYFGENGTTATIVSIDQHQGLRLRRADGKVGAVKWTTLQDKTTGRVRLAYGSALTIDARQSETLTDHLALMPGGTGPVNAFKMYPADTRNREVSQIIVSHGAEKLEVRNRRPMGDPWLSEATDAEMRAEILANMARNLSRKPEKALGVDMIEQAIDAEYGGIDTHQASWFRAPEQSHHRQQPAQPKPKERPREQKLIARQDRPAQHQARQETRSARPEAQRPKQPQRQPQRDRGDVVAELADALRREGFKLRGAPVMDGQWHREQVEGDKGPTKSGRYKAYDDGVPAGFIQNFKRGEGIRWRSERPRAAMTGPEREAQAAARAARDRENAAALEAATAKAQARWQAGLRPVRSHPYLTAKGISAGPEMRRERNGNLMTALRDGAGVIRNVQTITPGGEKRFVTGAQVSGLFSLIGEIDPDRPILIGEGVATARTMHEATGFPVAIAYNAGNLEAVSKVLAEIAPGSRQVFAADNDHHLPRKDAPLPNVGREKAEAAAAKVNGIVLLPSFGQIETRQLRDGEKVPTHWNDFAALFGKDELKSTIEATLQKEGIEMPQKRQEAAERAPMTQAERDTARQARERQSTGNTRRQATDQARQREQSQERSRSEERGLSR